MPMLDIIIVDKSGKLKQSSIKNYEESELYKKCGFKKPDGFEKQTEWGSKMDGKKYIVAVFAKKTGKATFENKYDFPPPIDTTLFFGSCLIIRYTKECDGGLTPCSLSLDEWNKIYEKLFGGFEDLCKTAQEDENEIDELENIPKKFKTKSGYLKDGFVVDSDDTSENDCDDGINDSSSDLSENITEELEDTAEGVETVFNLIGSELSEDEYETDTENDNDEDNDIDNDNETDDN